MLQPRVSVSANMSRNFVVLGLAYVLLTTVVTCQELNNDDAIEVSRIKRENVPENRDLTVLLVNDKRNEYNTKIGRYHNVKPLIGLLTSTARTFIQDGVTTEFATQILGTTLDNGRIYAQLLTKSSLVLYNKNSDADNSGLVKPTRIHSNFDGEWNVKQDLGFIDPEKFVLKNTDYIAPSSKMEIVYASKPVQDNVKYWNSPTSPDNFENQIFEEPTARRVQPNNEIPRYVQNEAFNYLDGPTIENDKKVEFIAKPSLLDNVNSLHRHSKAYEPMNEPKEYKDSRVNEDTLSESSVVKVKPNYDLPTFTIKNEFSPIFYYIDNVETRSSQHQAGQQTKLPKKLFGQKSEPRPKKTFTYAGFADFTTVVGDTVIIFTPNTETSRPQNPDEVNVFPSAKHVDKMNTKITFLAADIPFATSTHKAHEVTTATKLTTPSSDENRSVKALYNDKDSLKKVLYEVDKMPDSISIQYNNGFDFNLDVIQPSEAGVTTTESTRLTDNLQVIPIQDVNSQATEPLTFLRPSATIIEESKESVATESGNTADMYTNSAEESENTAAEVTDSEEEQGEEEQETTTEMEPTIHTTTESGHSEESFEDIETTTETKHETPEEISCTSGLETQSTMTTAYKTLTYLTTYFIPLESTETTTSIKSDVVVESNVGYLTNVVCKTNVVIEPTTVVSVVVTSSIHSSLEQPETTSEEIVLKAPPTEASTESSSKTTQFDEITTVSEEKQATASVEQTSVEELTGKVVEKEQTTTTTSTTTTERVEISVSTEKSITPVDKTTPQGSDESSEENEIDLIYKTLYTTYTYFTTFFGDQTSSVASHKSVVTNIITSTIDLSKLDPSLLGAFDDDEIAPTSVEIGRPTETFVINSIIDLVKNKDVIESVESEAIYSSHTPTPTLGDEFATIKPDAVKTYLTTYTFFTTIYVGSDANVCSRSEVYTNYVGPDELIPTKTNPLAAESTRPQFDFRNCKQVKRAPPANPEETASVETSVSMEYKDLGEQSTDDNKESRQPTPSAPLEVDMLFSVESNPVESENAYVTDVKSSSSKGERKYLENNNVLDDQISSESNIDEIMPSPTLLLQTSYTTFTYFTTMYIGKDSSKVKSRLETITNVVTETIMPKKELEGESKLPITYYTTFTYWTTLYKDKSTTITSREEIVSNVVTPVVQAVPTISPIDTTPIDIDSPLPPKDLEVELKPSLIDDSLEQDDGKATFYTTYTYFTTFYAGNTSQIRSSLETVTNIVDNTKVVEDNQLGRKVQTGSEKNLIQDNGEKPAIAPTVVKEEIETTKIPEASAAPATVLVGTYIDNLFAEVKPGDGSTTPTIESDKKILFSQVAVISGDSTVVTSDNKTLDTETTTTSTTTTTKSSEGSLISSTPEEIESSEADPEATTETKQEDEDGNGNDEDGNTRKKSRLTFTTKKPSFTPVIIPFASRNRPTFSPKRVPLLSSATTITRQDFTPTITATPTLKSVRPSGFGGNRKSSAFPGSSVSGSRRFSGRTSTSVSGNVPSASTRSSASFGRGSIQPTSRRTGFRSSSIRNNNADISSRSVVPRIRPTTVSRLRGSRQSASVSLPPQDQNESETSPTQQEENATEPLEEVTEAPVRTTNNPLSRFRRPSINRQPGTAITPRSTTTSTPRRPTPPRGRTTTTTRRTTTRTTTNPVLSLRRQRPNALFPRRNLFKQPDPEPEEEIKENEQKVEDSEEILEEEEFEDDTDYESSDRKEQQVSTPSTPAPRRSNAVQIRPFAFRRRSKRQTDNGGRRLNFRRPGLRTTSATPKLQEAVPSQDDKESELSATHKEENVTEILAEATEAPVKTTYNPLSRFKRPPISRQSGTAVTSRSTTTTTASPTAPPKKPPPKKGRTTTSTMRTTSRTTLNPILSLKRQRPSALFPKRNLFKKPEPEPEEEIKENEQKVENSEEIMEEKEVDDDTESIVTKEQQVSTSTTQAPKKSGPVQIRPFAFRRRSKRQADYGSRKLSNFRRPGPRTTRQPDPEPETEPPTSVTPKRSSNRFSSRLSSNSRTTTAAAPRSSARQSFIIRGESRTTTASAPSYKRNGKARSSSRTTTISSRPKAPRLASDRSRPSTSRSSGRSRTRTTTSRASSRQRNSFENFSGERYNNYNHIVNDGKFTVTHHIPTEVTIPVVNGKITEYKSVLSASPRLETLLANQISTSIGPLGNPQLILVSEATELAENGATKLIKFVLNETPTTTVIFTPTTIRGRKTSYSHILPSTVYNVEPVTQTIAPEINANVPLANLLLSQLLLGNQQPAINPLLALQGQGLLPQQPVVQTPVTELKTRTTTYVTTITDARETVLTITFRATPIETTIVDPTTNVITATEYITETVVTTPTAFAQAPQFNSLLLPLLLQQQQQQQQQQQAAPLQTANPLLGLGTPDLNLLQNNNLVNDIYSNSPKPNILSDLNSNENYSDDSLDYKEDAPLPPPPPKRRGNKPKPPKPAPPKMTSVVTLYVSGRHPGEFSTVLSTLVTDDTQTVRKREAIYYEDVNIQPSVLPTVSELFGSQENIVDNTNISNFDRYLNDPTESSETQSLESIVGEVSKHINFDASPTYVAKLASPSTIRDIQSSVDDVS